MALKIQYNKTFIQQLQKQLTIREKALPTLKSKETALRLEIKRTADHMNEIKKDKDRLMQDMLAADGLWKTFPYIVNIGDIDVSIKNIAGVKVPVLNDIRFEVKKVHFFNEPAWLAQGIEQMKSLLTLEISAQFIKKQLDTLNYARKKTTQKVNLYEKVQIPTYKDSILKIKRYLEDQENLAKSAQKILKERNRMKEALL